MNRSFPIHKFLARLRQSLADDTFVGLQLSGKERADNSVEQVDARLIRLKGKPHLSFTVHESKRDLTENRCIEEGIQWILARVGTEFRNALLRTSRQDWQFHRAANGRSQLVRHKPSTVAVPSRDHDQSKRTLLGNAASDWLQTLGIFNAAGHPKPSMANKFRQIRRYVEILHHLAQHCGWTTSEAAGQSRATGSPSLLEPPHRLTVADMGCGKGYLTFAAWHLFQRTLQRPVSVLGVETRSHLVTAANHAARAIHAEGLRFIQGEVATVPLTALDALIALHACDTATDDAIRRGIELEAGLIVVAPCCHQALRPELGSPEPFTGILRHGLFKERMAEWLTDGLRTLFLEWAGYETKVVEFVASEHTPKNLMIAALRKHPPFTDGAVQRRILELKRCFGIEQHALDDFLT